MKKILLCISLILFFACEPEHVNHHGEETNLINFERKISQISFSDFKKNKKANQSLSKFRDLSNSKRSSLNIDSVKIDRRGVKYFEFGEYHSYTFEIEIEHTVEGLLNFLLSYQEDGTYKTYIVHYDIGVDDKLKILQNERIDFSSKMKFFEIKNESSLTFLNKSTLSQAISNCPDGSCCAIYSYQSSSTGWTEYSYSTVDCPAGMDDGSESGGGSGNSSTTTTNTTGYSYPGTNYTNPFNRETGGSSTGSSSGSDGGPNDPSGLCDSNECLGDVTSPVLNDPLITTATQAQKVEILNSLIDLTSLERFFLMQSENEVLLTTVLYFLHVNKETSEAKTFSKKIINIDMILADPDIGISPTNSHISEISSCCPGDCCPDPYFYANDHIMHMQLGVDIVNNSLDAFFNLFVQHTELFGSDAWVGSRIRKIMKAIDIEVPASYVDDVTLGRIFQVRKRNSQLTVEFRQGLATQILEMGLNTFEIFAIVSPSKGGGAFLAINGGEKVTAVTLRNRLSHLMALEHVPNGPLMGKTIKHTFSKHGSHNTANLIALSKNGNRAVGQWLFDSDVEKLIARHLDQLSNGVKDIPLPENMLYIGRVFNAGDGQIFTPTHIRLVPSGSGVKTAYPINENLTPLNSLGTYIPE
jgi:hypothetical protein